VILTLKAGRKQNISTCFLEGLKPLDRDFEIGTPNQINLSPRGQRERKWESGCGSYCGLDPLNC
ncbi:MAG TPA: hypothetical protein VGJ66_22730, partial [Pyrinomonadaceae bacterium]